MIVDLTLPMALELSRNLAPRDRYEITGTEPDLERWARTRCALPGSSWALVEGEVLAAGGVIDAGRVGTLWIAGRAGWTRYVKQALWIWKLMRGLQHPYGRLECRVYESNPAARAFAERLGFLREKLLERFNLRGENLILYARAP